MYFLETIQTLNLKTSNLFLIFLVIFYIKYININTIIRTIYDSWGKIKKVKDTISTQYTSPYLVWKKTFEIVAKNVKWKFLKLLDNRITKISRNKYEVRYQIEGKEYCLITQIKRGPSFIIDIVNENGENRKDILPYLISYNKELTPAYFNENMLSISFRNGGNKQFQKRDLIDFK